MADGSISVELSANVTSFINGLNAASTASSSTDRSVSVMSSNISRNISNVNRLDLSQFNRSLQAGQLSISRLATSGATVRPALSNITVGANQAGFALTNLGRVAQDAPFGFIGIQNNLNPLLESFQRLRAETGSNGAAFRALGQSLLGPAGIGFALSAVSAAILFYQQYQQKANKATKEAKTETDAYVNSLSELDQVQVRGAKNAQKEITELNTLYGITQNVALSTKERRDAVDELQKQYPSYFKNIKDETILSGGAADAYDRLSQAIIATAKARAAQDLITKNSSRQLENEQKIQDELAKYDKQKLLAAKALKALGDTEQSGSARFNAREAEQAEKARAQSAETIRNLKKDSQILDQNNLKLTEAITAEIQKGADLSGKVGDLSEDKGKKLKTFAEILAELNQSLLINDNQFQNTFGDRNKGAISAYQSAIESLLNNGFKPLSAEVLRLKKEQQDLFQLPDLSNVSANLGIKAPTTSTGKTTVGIQKPDLGLGFSELEKEQADIIQKQLKFNEDFNNIVTDGLVGGISGIGQALGEALANGGNAFEALGKSLLSSLGGVLTQLGEMALGVGAGLIGIKAALKSLNPAVAIAAGVALIALGSLVSSKASSIGGKIQGGGGNAPTAFANGGIVSGPTLGLMGEYAGAKNNPEVIAPLDKLKSMLGQDEKGLARKAQQSQNTIILQPSLEVNADKFLVTLKRAEEDKRRT